MTPKDSFTLRMLARMAGVAGVSFLIEDGGVFEIDLEDDADEEAVVRNIRAFLSKRRGIQKVVFTKGEKPIDETS